MSRILLTVPAWNEAEIIAESLRRLHGACGRLLDGHDWQIEVAENGSTDMTSDIVAGLMKDLGQISLRHCKERGKGLAIRESWLAGEGAYDLFLFMDADLSTDLTALPGLVRPLLTNEADLVCGSRLVSGSIVHRSLLRQALTHTYSTWQQIVLGLPVRDAQCGFKAASARVVTDIVPRLTESQYLFDTELLALTAARDYRVHELPVEWRESMRRSHVRPFQDGWAFITGVRNIRDRILCQTKV